MADTKVLRIHNTLFAFPWVYCCREEESDVLRRSFPSRVEMRTSILDLSEVYRHIYNTRHKINLLKELYAVFYNKDEDSSRYTLSEEAQSNIRTSGADQFFIFVAPITGASMRGDSFWTKLRKAFEFSYFVRGDKTEELCAECSRVFSCMAEGVSLYDRQCDKNYATTGEGLMTEELKKRFVKNNIPDVY